MTLDKEIVVELFSRYSHLVFGTCLKYLKSEEESRDAVMTIFEKLLEDLKKHEINNFKSWLHSVSRNFCLMELRKKKKWESKEEISNAVMESGYVLHLHEESSQEANVQKLEGCMKKLVSEQKRCIELFYIEEKCYLEICKATRFTMNEVKSYIQNGKRNLKNCMGRKDHE
jgi:RNA polymerase sigma-70 factor (ECF subfamily)